MISKTSKQTYLVQRHQTVDAAIASVRMEGLEPSTEVLSQAKSYADGLITLLDLQLSTVLAVQTKESIASVS